MRDYIAEKSDWKTVDMPEKNATFLLHREFTPAQMEALRRGNVPQVMEDKWFWYMEDNTLYAHRSWTGLCIYTVAFRADGSHLVTVNRDPAQYPCRSETEDLEQLNALLDWWSKPTYDYYGEWVSETVDAIEKSKDCACNADTEQASGEQGIFLLDDFGKEGLKMNKWEFLCKTVCFVLIALTAATLVLSCTTQAPQPGMRFAIHISILLAAVCSLVYVLSGARKADAGWLAAFEVLLAVSVFLTTLRAIQMGHDIRSIAIYILSFGAICIFIAAKDLGKSKSILLCAFFALAQAAAVILQSADNFSLTRTLGVLSQILMAVLLLIMLALKYLDKAARKKSE